ncbi:MAG: glycosyltransferase family 9 protein [Pseudomonadota bacterium]|nr:glycosyltransferase family 9 protein [Pseudomonadota bacterium]
MKILAIKFAQFGDIVQSLGAFQDISNHYNVKIDILTSKPYRAIFENLPFVDKIYVSDRRKKDLIKLHTVLPTKSYNYVFDLPGSRIETYNTWLRNKLYEFYIFRKSKFITLLNTIPKKEIKKHIKSYSHLDWNAMILKRMGIEIKQTYHSPITYAQDNSFNPPAIQKPYIFIAPFCSKPKSADYKRWPNFKALMELLQKDFPSLNLVTVPGPGELELADQLPATKILDKNGKATSIPQLIKIINQACYVISLDTGAAHVAYHLGKPGRVIGGKGMEPQALGLTNDDFKIIHFSKKDLKDVTADEFYAFIKSDLEKHVEALA